MLERWEEWNDIMIETFDYCYYSETVAKNIRKNKANATNLT